MDKYSWPFISTDFTSTDSAKLRSKIFGEKNCEKFQKVKLEFGAEATIYIAFTLYLHSIYTVLGIIGNLEMI